MKKSNSFTYNNDPAVQYDVAVIGAGASAVTYSVSTLISGQPWNSGNFWKSVGVGAVGGAIGGGFGAVGSLSALGTFGNSVGYSQYCGDQCYIWK